MPQSKRVVIAFIAVRKSLHNTYIIKYVEITSQFRYIADCLISIYPAIVDQFDKLLARRFENLSDESSYHPDKTGFYIEGLREPISLGDFVAITTKWNDTNRRRARLINKKASRTLSQEERREFRHLQKLAGARRQFVAPLPMKEMAEIEAEFRRRGWWPSQ
jgi:hypothetical protein